MTVKSSLSSRPGCDVPVLDSNGKWHFHKVIRPVSPKQYREEHPNDNGITYKYFFYEVEPQGEEKNEYDRHQSVVH